MAHGDSRAVPIIDYQDEKSIDIRIRSTQPGKIPKRYSRMGWTRAIIMCCLLLAALEDWIVLLSRFSQRGEVKIFKTAVFAQQMSAEMLLCGEGTQVPIICPSYHNCAAGGGGLGNS